MAYVLKYKLELKGKDREFAKTGIINFKESFTDLWERICGRRY